MQDLITDKFWFDCNLQNVLEELGLIYISVKESFYYVIIIFCMEEERGRLQSLIRTPFLLIYRREMQSSRFASSAIQRNRDGEDYLATFVHKFF